MAWHRRANPAPTPAEAAAREYTCPTCGEPPGSRCNTEGGYLMTYSHAARRRLAEAATATN